VPAVTPNGSRAGFTRSRQVPPLTVMCAATTPQAQPHGVPPVTPATWGRGGGGVDAPAPQRRCRRPTAGLTAAGVGGRRAHQPCCARPHAAAAGAGATAVAALVVVAVAPSRPQHDSAVPLPPPNPAAPPHPTPPPAQQAQRPPPLRVVTVAVATPPAVSDVATRQPPTLARGVAATDVPAGRAAPIPPRRLRVWAPRPPPPPRAASARHARPPRRGAYPPPLPPAVNRHA